MDTSGFDIQFDNHIPENGYRIEGAFIGYMEISSLTVLYASGQAVYSLLQLS